MLTRRNFLILGVAAAATFAADPVEAALRVRPQRSLSLYNLHTGESFRSVYWAEGRYLPQSMLAIDRVLRDHRTDDVHRIDPRVLDLLAALQEKLKARQPFQIISGYRSPATNAMLANTGEGVAKRSLHLEGKAVDIRLPKVPVRTVGRAARRLKAGGVGLYPASNFVHIDTGPVRTW